MAPSATQSNIPDRENLKKPSSGREYLRAGTSLDTYQFDSLTPVIGREYIDVNIVNDILNSPDSSQKIKDLAITISERGVVFFRQQDNLTNDLQKQFIHRLGQLTGKPETSSLHIHPVFNDDREFGEPDAEISTIHSSGFKKLQLSTANWHSDISFEPVPADYTSLRLTQPPKTGGDTLWASGYELFDRISEPYQRFLEGLSVTHVGKGFLDVAARGQAVLYDKPRGSPENVGTELSAVHPCHDRVVRTNPVTGWKSLFGVGPFPKVINGLTKDESDKLLTWFHDLLIRNHDLQVRFKWKSPNDIAIWDNRSVYHTATFDFEGLGERSGNRAVGNGERPFFDPGSKSRRQDRDEREAQI